MNYDEKNIKLVEEISEKRKKGLPYIITSIFVWTFMIIVMKLPISMSLKNIWIISLGIVITPISIVLSKLLKQNVMDKTNHLVEGLFSNLNSQVLYIVILVMLAFKSPKLVIIVYAMIYGINLYSYGFYYNYKLYNIVAALIPLTTFFVYVILKKKDRYITPMIVTAYIVILGVGILIENKKMKSKKIKK